MNQAGYRGIVALCLAIALVAGATAALGAFSRGSGETATAVSLRGERFDYVTQGVYAHNPVRVVAEGVGWDYLTLFVAVPALLASLPFVARGSLQGRLFALGILGYLFYQYLMYAVYWAFGPLFVPFILIYASSAVGMVWIASTIAVAELPSRFTETYPRKSMAAFCMFMAVQLVAMWSVRIAAGLRGDWEATALDGMPAMSVQALDLGVIVPLAVATAALVWARRPWGYLLGPVFAVKGVTMAGAIVAMLVSAAVVEGRLETGAFVLFSAATAVFGALAWRMFASIRTASEPTAVAV